MVNRSFNQSSGAGLDNTGQPAASLISMPEVMAVLRRWWWQCALAGTVCAAVAGGIVWATFTPIYEALALVLIKSDPDYIAFKEQSNGLTFAWTQLETLRSPIVLSKVAGKPEIANQKEAKVYGDVEQWLVKKLSVRFIGQSDLCQITFQSQSPQVAAMIVNEIVDQYLKLHQDTQSEQTENIIKLLVKQQREREEEVNSLRKNLRKMTKRATGYDPLTIHGTGSNNNSMVVTRNPLAEIEQRRVTAEVEYSVLMAQLNAYEEAAAQNKVEVPPELLQQALFDEPEIRALIAHLGAHESNLSGTKRAAKPGRTDLVGTKEKAVQDAQRKLDEAMVRLRPLVMKAVERQMLAKQTEKISELKHKVEIEKRLLAQWDERMEKERAELESHGDDRLSLQFAHDDLARSEEVHALIADRIVALKTEKLAPARAIKQHPARIPTDPIEKIPYAKLGAAGAGAFVLPFALAFLWERLARRISDGNRLAADANVPLLGEIAMLPTRRATGKTPSTTYFRERVTFEESIDALRVTLTHLPESKDIGTLLVTSAISAEGKTNLATSLAISLARATHEPLLIIDGDMRDPDVHEIFGAELRPGLANVLDNSCSLDEAIVKTEVENVDLLPAGRLKYSPHFLLRNGAFQSILDGVKGRYRYVIIDSPPVLSASESVVLASACDAVLVCTRCDYSRSPQLCAAKERLLKAGARVLGAVISGVPTRSWAQRYGGYGYGWERYAAAYHSFYSPPQNLLEHQDDLPSEHGAGANGHA